MLLVIKTRIIIKHGVDGTGDDAGDGDGAHNDGDDGDDGDDIESAGIGGDADK